MKLSRTLFIVILNLIIAMIFSSIVRANPTQLYTVELLVFKYTNSSAAQQESWLLDREALSAATLKMPAVLPYPELDPSELTLKTESWALRQKLNYPILLHTAWQQPISSVRSAKPFTIIDDQQQILGTLKISNSNYIDIEANFQLPDEPQYTLTEKLRVRDDEVHYLDHPAFGILIKVMR